MISLRPKFLKRYKDIAWLLFKYGRGDLVKQSGLHEALDVEPEVLDDDSRPDQFAKDLEQLGPTYVKLGQFLSTRTDLLSAPYLKSLERLQDDVEAIDFETVRAIIEDDLGVKISKAFADLDEKPLAAASLGQVHRAKLRDGREVVVKVQRPDIRERISEDLSALVEVAQFLESHSDAGKRYQVLRIVETLKRSLLNELDFHLEAENLRLLARNLRAFPLLIFPEPINDYTSTRVLTMTYVSGTKITEVNPTVFLEVDRAALADELFNAYLHQILVDGVFHADPHPGNLLLTRDHKIALLDLGMVARMEARLQQQMVSTILAISEGRGEDTASQVLQYADADRHAHVGQFKQGIAQLVGDTYNKPVRDLSLGRIILEIQRIAADAGVVLPGDFVMLGKTMMNLDKVVVTLCPDYNINEAMQRASTKLVSERMKQKLTLGSLYHSFLESAAFMQDLPERANKLTRILSENGLRIKVDAIDEDRLMENMQKIANRIATGLVLAALIVGAALMMDIETSATLFGYPLIAILCFLGAGGLGFYTVIKSMMRDEEKKKE